MGNAFYLYNNSLQFNGVNSYIACPNSDLLNTPSLTIEVWFMTYVENTGQALYTKPFWHADCDLYIANSAIAVGDPNYKLGALIWKLSNETDDQIENIYGSEVIKAYKPYHVICTADMTKMYLYVNGVLNDSKNLFTSPRNINTNSVYIGDQLYESIYHTKAPFYGEIYIAAQYSEMWDSTKVLNRFNNLSQDIIPENCVLFYRGKDVSNPIVDKSNNGNNGILYNMTAKNNKRIRNLKSNLSNGYQEERMIYFKDESGLFKRVNI